MSSFGAVIPVAGLNIGFLGQVSRTGGGDPFIVAKQANINNVANISFGDTVVVLPDSTGGTYKQLADFIATGGGTNISTATATSVTLTPASNTLGGIFPGMFVFGAGIPAGTTVVSVNAAAGTATISKAATASATVNLNYAAFGGIAVREVKTQIQYTTLVSGFSPIGAYTPGQMTEALVRGSITTKIYVGTPVANGPVYVRAILNGAIPAGIVGGLEASADGVNNILLPNVSFKTGVQDGNGVSEVTLLVRQSV